LPGGERRDAIAMSGVDPWAMWRLWLGKIKMKNEFGMSQVLSAANLTITALKALLTPRPSRFAWIFLFVLSSSVQAFESAPYFPLNIMGGYWNYSGWIHTGPSSSLPSIGLGSNSGRRGTKTVIRKPG